MLALLLPLKTATAESGPACDSVAGFTWVFALDCASSQGPSQSQLFCDYQQTLQESIKLPEVGNIALTEVLSPSPDTT